jgi:hypothetical protein
LHRLALLLGVLVLTAAGDLGAQAPTAEAVLVELQLGRIATRTVEAFRAGDAALVPLGAFFDLAEIRSARLPDGSVEATSQPGNVPFAVDPASRTLRVGQARYALDAAQLVQTPTDVYLDTRALGRALNVEWDVSWADLQVTVVEPGTLPVARRIRREAMLRAELAASSAPEFAGLQLGLERGRIDGLVFDYSVLAPMSGLSDGAYSAMLGLDLLGGSFAAGLESQPGVGRAPRSEISWTGVWRESPYVAQLRLGDAFSTGPRPRSLRGVSISNSPYLRPAILGNVPFAGQLGQGWTVEAYRGGRLIGFDSVNALGRFTFDVPIEYGENPVDFIAYGPFGEMRTFNQTYRVRNADLPARRFEYGLSLGACRTVQCRANGNIDLRYGPSARWTVRAGMDQFWRDSLNSLSHPYAGVVGALTNALQVEAEAVANAVLRGVVRYEPSLNLQVQAEANRFARSAPNPLLTPAGRLHQFTLSAFLRPTARLGSNYLEASVDQIGAVTGDLLSGRLGASIQVSNMRLMPSIRTQRQAVIGGPTVTQSFVGFNTVMLPRPSLGPLLGQLTVRTMLELQTGVGASSGAAFLGLPIARWLRTEAGVTWYRGGRGTGFQLLVAVEPPGVRSYTTVAGGGGLPTTGSQYVSGSAIYNPSRHGVDFSGTPALARGGIAGRVFLDANANGRFDAGDQPLAGVRVIVGPVYAASDSSGEYHAWDVLPYEPTMVTVDSATLASPLWVPAFAASQVEPSPNRYRQLDIPVLPGGTVEGRVSMPSGAPAGGGIVLVFTHRSSGERRVMATFGDGTFYSIGLRPGDWELSVDPKTLDALQMAAEPVAFHIAPNPDGAEVAGLQVQLR